MPRDTRNPIDVLKSELEFIRNGGYAQSAHDPSRAKLELEDSPTCMNHDHKRAPAPCSECLLIQFVPANKRNEKVPCRHIPVTPDGETLLDLYRGSPEVEIDEALAGWLRETITQLEIAGKSRKASSELH